MHQHDHSKRYLTLPTRSVWQGFTFVGQSHQKAPDSTVPSPSLQQDGDGAQRQLLLSQTQVSDRVCIITLPQAAHDLVARGLACGIAVQIVSRTASGSVVVSLEGEHLGIGAAIAQTIIVEPI